MPDLRQEGLAARGLGVKALEWQDTEIPAYGVLHAKTTFGTYFIERDGTGRFLVQHDHAGVGSYSTLEAARAAAQADYAARILAALEDTGEPALIREAEARGMERAANIAEADAKQLTEEALQWRADNMPFAAQFAEEQAKAGPRIAASIRAAKAAP